ncbi:uncharacterized protein EAF01_004799 [Botrytis porri]|uniref:uncharacterized protein n=1 Tax=Botrytis porri TaxID=87229 RepID=UPI0019012197|nr:uncharacterized protein EAF01_004799 [Botrytis porri]KAF7907212.1 hypothetical protein EAF01_004799 [Botrytis porri]
MVSTLQPILNTLLRAPAFLVSKNDTTWHVYNQGISILYSCNTFDINNPETVLYLSQTVIPSRFKSIKSLQLDVNASMGSSTECSTLPGPRLEFLNWKKCLEILEWLEGLQNLRLRMYFDLLRRFPDSPYSDELVQKPLENSLEGTKLSSLRGQD